MVPVVTPEEMAIIDGAAAEPLDVLVRRAGNAVARTALRMLGGTYGRVVHIVAGPGNNGADGRIAGQVLSERGVKVRVFDAASCPASLPPADLVIDAAYGTGFRGTWSPPGVGATPVLAVDIPSGVDALTGAAHGPVLAATRTVTFQGLKPGLLFPPGSEVAGDVEVADIGLADGVQANARAHLVQRDDVVAWLPERAVDAHKWRSAVRLVAGSVGMTGAACLASEAAMRAGAGIVHLSSVGTVVPAAPPEVVQVPLTDARWAEGVADGLQRFHALVVGPGVGRHDDTAAQVRELVRRAALPVVVDGDGLFAAGWSADGAAELLAERTMPTVLTPHDGEYALLAGAAPIADRLVAARRLAADTRCVVLLKGAATVVADARGRTFVVSAGDERLATAGSGDVLSGVVGALLARGMPALEAAAAGAWLHGRAARRGPLEGLVAGDLPALVGEVLSELVAA